MKTIKNLLVRVSLIIIVSLMITSCGSTKTADGAVSGALIGGLVGGWDGAATGALVGGGVGLMADSADDKKVRQDQKERELRMMEKANSQPVPQPVSKPKSTGVLNGSSWKVVSIVDETKSENDFASWIISFQSDRKAITIVLNKDGKSETFSESYTIVDDVIIFTGKDYVTNAKFSVTDKQMIIVTDTARVVLEEV
ncbi:hypothetical protein QWY87_00430 [Lutimonas halocynthiae]|uniref:hypothetical protein n=1 Tax=Lutimonas halocynthiae TaxID=1446477 RepID=UPI0025B42AC2|nr:hypothetical protein [Lutimonas halocynthiae]MDN3641147.1 hypothetical protein [Lutimonas halocynthiae]